MYSKIWKDEYKVYSDWFIIIYSCIKEIRGKEIRGKEIGGKEIGRKEIWGKDLKLFIVLIN